MIINDICLVHIRPSAVLRTDDSSFLIKVIKYSSEQCKRSCEIHMYVQKRFNRAVQTVNKSNCRSNNTDTEIRIYPFDYQIPAGEINKKRPYLGKHPHDDSEPSAAALLF